MNNLKRNTMILRDVIFNTRIWVADTDPVLLKGILLEALESSGHNTVEFIEHFFTPEGYTAIWLLAESHLAVHTFPEKSGSYIELSSCSPLKVGSFVNQIKNSEIKILQIIEI